MDQSERRRRAEANRKAMAQRATAFAAAVTRLTPEAWDRLAVRCAALDDPSAAALIDRALLAAKPFELPLPELVRERLVLRAIAGTLRAFITSTMLAYEVGVEFESRFDDLPRAQAQARARTRTSGKPDIDAVVDAHFLIESTLMARHAVRPLGPGLITAIRAAREAVQRHNIMPRESFAAAYAIMETEIPFSRLI